MATKQDADGHQPPIGGSAERPQADDLVDELVVQRLSRWLAEVAVTAVIETADD